jgi:hypothetical protein
MKIYYAGVAELADVQDLGSCAERRAGSSPVARTTDCPKTRYFSGFSAELCLVLLGLRHAKQTFQRGLP